MRHLTVVERQVEFGRPVGLVVTIDRDYNNFAWIPGESELRPLPNLHRGVASSKDVLSDEGRALLFTRQPADQAGTASQVCRLSFETGAIEVMELAGRPPIGHISYAGSPAERQVVIAHCHPDPLDSSTEPYANLRVHVSRGSFQPANAVSLAEYRGLLSGEADDVAVQWSPSGQHVALSIAIWQGAGKGFLPSIVLLDAETGREVTVLDGLSLVGSVSWSPDGQRLLVSEFPVPRVQLLDLGPNDRRPLPGLSATGNVGSSGAYRPLGFADDDTLLAVRQRGRFMSVHSVGLESGFTKTLMRWSGGEDMYPVTARLPSAPWTDK